MKKILSLVLVLVLGLGTVTSSFASSNFNNVDGQVKVLKDNENVRIVEGSDSQGTYHITFNKKDNTCDVKIIKKSTKEVVRTKVKIPKVSKDKELYNEKKLSSKGFFHDDYQKTYINYEYFRDGDQWELRKPKTPFISYYYLNREETSENRDDLENFKDAVDDVNFTELAAIGTAGYAGVQSVLAVGSAVLAITSGFTLTAVFWKTATEAVLGSTAAAAAIHMYNKACTEAYEAFDDCF